ncbi:unnamed protein product [Caenorhabditis bovis]|uniref:CCR4-NOT transcription complex subunit 11 n=1 Tax=Caenorhabditis bovis TaxID=2654633 RepID=A0A8S1EQR8_9PELO|nr:unnamed protein product [Caenorhabditis bovis]
MGKKKTKKGQKTHHAQPESKKKPAPVDDEEFDKGDDLYISENDTNLIANHIRTTNKSFNSLGNQVVEQFLGRCALGLCHALLSLYDETCLVKDDVIRRLNIIYIVYRLPEVEQELRVKPQKNINDILNHMFQSFLCYVENSELEVEACLARIILSNNANLIEKLTAADFITKSSTLANVDFDRDILCRWEDENTRHWSLDLDDDVPVAALMRHLGHQRKDFEAGMQEAFYPIYHPVPTCQPMRLDIQNEEVRDAKTRNRMFQTEEQCKLLEGVYYLETPDLQKKLKKAFEGMKEPLHDFQEHRCEGMSDDELADVNYVFDLVNLKDDEFDEFRKKKRLDSDEFDPGEQHLVADAFFNVMRGINLGPHQVNLLKKFLDETEDSNPLFIRMIAAFNNDNHLKSFIVHNHKFACELASRALRSNMDTVVERCMTAFESLTVMFQSMELTLRISKDLRARGGATPLEREHVGKFARLCIERCTASPTSRNIRLVTMLLNRLLRDKTLLPEEVSTEVKAFTLQFSDQPEATLLYKTLCQITMGIPFEDSDVDDEGSTVDVGTGSSAAEKEDEQIIDDEDGNMPGPSGETDISETYQETVENNKSVNESNPSVSVNSDQNRIEATE